MSYSIYITHELIMETTRIYSRRNFKNCENDFEKIKSFKKSALGKFIMVEGTVHLYGYKIAGDGYYSGFYDVINQQLYTSDKIKNAIIIEHKSECIYESPLKTKRLRRRNLLKAVVKKIGS